MTLASAPPTALLERHRIHADASTSQKNLDPLSPDADWLKFRSSPHRRIRHCCGNGGEQVSVPSAALGEEAGRVNIKYRTIRCWRVFGFKPHIEELAVKKLRQTYPDAERLDWGSEVTFTSKLNPAMSCTPDLLIATNAGGEGVPQGICVEIKTTSNFSDMYVRKVETSNGVRDVFSPPNAVLLQVQHQLAVLCGIYGDGEAIVHVKLDEYGNATDDTDTSHFGWAGAICCFPLGRAPSSIIGLGEHIALSPPIWPDLALMLEMEEAGEAMTTCLTEGISPTAQRAPDYYQKMDRPTLGTPDAVAGLSKSKHTITADGDLLVAHRSLIGAEKDSKPHNDKAKSLKEQIKQALLDAGADTLINADGEILAKYSAADTLKWEDFCAEANIAEDTDFTEAVIRNFDLAEKHTTTSDKSRRLTIKR